MGNAICIAVHKNGTWDMLPDASNLAQIRKNVAEFFFEIQQRFKLVLDISVFDLFAYRSFQSTSYGMLCADPGYSTSYDMLCTV